MIRLNRGRGCYSAPGSIESKAVPAPASALRIIAAVVLGLAMMIAVIVLAPRPISRMVEVVTVFTVMFVGRLLLTMKRSAR